MRGTRFAHLIEFDNVDTMASVNGGIGIGVKNSMPYMKKGTDEYQITVERWDNTPDLPSGTETAIYDLSSELAGIQGEAVVYMRLTFMFGAKYQESGFNPVYLTASAMRSMELMVTYTAEGRVLIPSHLKTAHAGNIITYNDAQFGSTSTITDVHEGDISISVEDGTKGSILIMATHTLGNYTLSGRVKTEKQIMTIMI